MLEKEDVCCELPAAESTLLVDVGRIQKNSPLESGGDTGNKCVDMVTSR